MRAARHSVDHRSSPCNRAALCQGLPCREFGKNNFCQQPTVVHRFPTCVLLGDIPPNGEVAMVQVGLEPFNVASTIEAKTIEQIENFL